MSTIGNALKLGAASGVTLALVLGATGLAVAKPMKEVTVTAPSDDLTTRVERVSYRDLTLTRVSDQKKLNGRVGRAVNNVCGSLDGVGVNEDWRACRTGAWRGARPQIALAIRRAHEIAANGYSSIPPVTIVLAFPSR